MDLRFAAVEPLRQGVRPRLHGFRAPHGRPGGDTSRRDGRRCQALQARPAQGRHDAGHRRAPPVGAARRLRAARSQAVNLLGDRPGHRRRQGARRAEERHAVVDPAAGHRPAGGHPHRQRAGHPRPGDDEPVFPDRLPGIGGHRRLRRPSGDRRRRSLPAT